MAVTVTATKIDITAGTETLKSVYTAVAASGFPGIMTEDTADKEYTIINAELEISAGATLDITNASYEDGYLQWTLSANRAPGLDVLNTGTLTCTAPGFTFNLDSNNGNYNYWYIYGNMTLTGTVAKPIVITRYYRMRFFSRTSGNTISWDYVNFTDASSYSASGSPIWIDYGYASPDYTFDHITITDDGTSTYGLILDSGMDDTGITFDNYSVTSVRYGIAAHGQNFKMTNSTFEQTYYDMISGGGNNGGTYYKNQYTEYHANTLKQPKITFEDCTFKDNYVVSVNEVGLRVNDYILIKVKNCIFQGENAGNPLAYGLQGLYGSRFLLQGGIAGQTWTDVTNTFYFNTSHAPGYYEVYELDLTVNDSGGSPLENVSVTVRQKEGHEHHQFLTDASGNIKDCHGDNPVFIYREILTNTPTYDVWSDGSGSLVHIITISHPDYQVDTREVAFDQNRSITAQLTANAVGVTTIYDATIHGGTIY